MTFILPSVLWLVVRSLLYLTVSFVRLSHQEEAWNGLHSLTAGICWPQQETGWNVARVAMRKIEHTRWYMQCAWPYSYTWPARSQATKPKGLELWLNCCIIAMFTVGGVLAGIGSVRNIVVHAKDYHVL